MADKQDFSWMLEPDGFTMFWEKHDYRLLPGETLLKMVVVRRIGLSFELTKFDVEPAGAGELAYHGRTLTMKFQYHVNDAGLAADLNQLIELGYRITEVRI